MPRFAGFTESILGLALLVLMVIFLLYGVDKSLASLEQSELRAEARNRYRLGNSHLQAGRALEAIGDFERAHALERGNREYEITLAAAQIAGNQLRAADDTLNEVLQLDSNDARANLLMARVMVAEHRYPEADSYYHRAIYGSWLSGAGPDRVQARLELVDFLAKHGTQSELLSELLPLESEAKTNRDFARELPELFLRAGSVTRAADAYRSLIKQNPDDVQAYAGLGRAELLQGNYQAAQVAITNALRRKPGDATLAQSMDLVGKVMALDPTPRRLPSIEKYRRSVVLLGLTEDALKSCLGGKDTPADRPLLAFADGLRGMKAPGALPNELAEERLDAAEQLWQARSKLCANPAVPDDALALVMRKLAQ
jgi:tetratricopeptide (TPR) repeat protein